MIAGPFTVVVLAGKVAPSDWVRRVALTARCRLITSSQINEEATALVMKDLDRGTELPAQLTFVREHMPDAEAEVLRRHGIGEDRVLFHGMPGHYPLAIDGWILDLSGLQPRSHGIDPRDDRGVALRRLAEARHALAAEARRKSTRPICYLPSRISDEERSRRTLKAMEQWHLL